LLLNIFYLSFIYLLFIFYLSFICFLRGDGCYE